MVNYQDSVTADNCQDTFVYWIDKQSKWALLVPYNIVERGSVTIIDGDVIENLTVAPTLELGPVWVSEIKGVVVLDSYKPSRFLRDDVVAQVTTWIEHPYEYEDLELYEANIYDDSQKREYIDDVRGEFAHDEFWEAA